MIGRMIARFLQKTKKGTSYKCSKISQWHMMPGILISITKKRWKRFQHRSRLNSLTWVSYKQLFASLGPTGTQRLSKIWWYTVVVEELTSKHKLIGKSVSDC